jgi:putative monooxygenase
VSIHPTPPPIDIGAVIGRSDRPPNRRRGGDIRTLLSPDTVGAAAGFLGTLTLEPGEIVTEHWHPYSEEFLYCSAGSVTVRLNGEDIALHAEQAVHIPIGVRHRVLNDGGETAFFVFFLGPLAPRPDLGHVDTEAPPGLPAGSRR